MGLYRSTDNLQHTWNVFLYFTGGGGGGGYVTYFCHALNFTFRMYLIRAPLRPKMSLTSLSKCTPAHGEGPPGLKSPDLSICSRSSPHTTQSCTTALLDCFFITLCWAKSLADLQYSKQQMPVLHPHPKILPPPSPFSLVHINQQGAFVKHRLPFRDRIQIQIKQNLQCTNFNFTYQ